MIKHVGYVLLMLFMAFASGRSALAATLDDSLLNVESRWARAAYKTDGRQQGKALKALLNDVRSLHEAHPNRPEAYRPRG